VILYRSPSGFHERSPRQRCWPRDWDGRWVCNYCRTGFSRNHGDWIRGNHPPKAPHFRTGSCRHGPEGNMSGPTFQVSEWSYNLARWPDVWCSNLIPLQTLNIPQYSSVWGPTSVMPPISMTGDEDPKASGRCTFLQQPHGGRLVCAIVARPYSRPQTSWFFGVKDDPETPWWWQASIDIDGKSSQYLDVHHQNQAVCLLNIGVTRFDSPPVAVADAQAMDRAWQWRAAVILLTETRRWPINAQILPLWIGCCWRACFHPPPVGKVMQSHDHHDLKLTMQCCIMQV
jgi:hypothetical protein